MMASLSVGSLGSSSPNNPYIRVIDEYVYNSYFNLTTKYDEKLHYHSLTVVAENLHEETPHNFTMILETTEIIKSIDLYHPSGHVENSSKNGKQYINAFLNGTNFTLELRFTGTTMNPDPMNLSIAPSDTNLFSTDTQNRLTFSVWLNVSRYLPSVWLRINPETYPSPNIQQFMVNTELTTGTNYTSGDSVNLELLDIPVGNHFIEFEISYEGFEGDFHVSISASDVNNFTIPTAFFLDGMETFPEKTLLFRYFTYRVEFLRGVIPWVYGYHEPECYSLDYLSSKDFMLTVDTNSREVIEYLVLDSEIEEVRVEEMDVYGNSNYEIILRLNSSSQVSLGLMVYEKTWFLGPNDMSLDDIPSHIREKYLKPSSSFDGEWIDVDNSLVQLWAKQIVGNETNPFFIARSLFQNLTETLEYAEEFKQFQRDREHASATLKSRKGVCRHFARAYAALAMVANLPVRTVRGTAFGLFNETYKKNHEWNEVYFPGYGWVALDVTWEDFGSLSNAHLAYTYWRYQQDTLEVSDGDDVRPLEFRDQTKQVLYRMITISEDRIGNLKSQKLSHEVEEKVKKSEELLNQASKQAEIGNVHDALLGISETNLIINSLEKMIQTSSPQHFDLYLLLVALSVIAALATAVLNYLSRPLLVRTIERHSDELKAIAENWLDEVPNIPDSRQPLTEKPDPIKIPSEDLLLFHDLKEHSPRELRVFETWNIFKQKLDEYNQKRFSICEKVIEHIKSETQIPVTSKSQDNGIFYPHFVEAVHMDANDLARGAKPYYTELIKEQKIEARADKFEFWPAGRLFARGSANMVERAKKFMVAFLNTLEEKSYTKTASDLMEDEKELKKLHEEVLRRIKNLIAIPVFPGKCKYIKRAVPGVYERIRNFFFPSGFNARTTKGFLKKCVRCSKEIPIASEQCSHCGTKQP